MEQASTPPLAHDAVQHDVHAIAEEANQIEASIEKFFDEALIGDFQQTPLHTLEGVLEERRERCERDERIRGRAQELLREELEKGRQAKELKELEDAISASQAPPPAAVAAVTAAAAARGGKERGGSGGGSREPRGAASASASAASAPAAAPAAAEVGGGAAADDDAAPPSTWAEAVATAPVKLEGAGKSHGLKPYVANLTDFVGEGEASRHVRELRAESELLRKCMGESRDKPNAFQEFLKRGRGAALPL